MRQRRLIAVVLAVAAAAAAFVTLGCSVFGRAPERLSIAIVDLPATGLVHLARHAGYFRDAGVDVRFVSFATGRDAIAAMLDGRVDAATTFETPLVTRALEGDRPRILTTLHQSPHNTRLVVPQGRGIAGPEDLRGRKVGVTRGTNAEFFLETLATLAGLDPLEIKEVDLPPQDIGPMLARGRIDAAAIWYPWALCGHPPLEKVECVELFADGYTEFSLLVTRDDVLASKRDALKGVIRALARAERLVLERPDAALPALAAELPGGGGAHLAEAWRRVTPQLGLDNLLIAVLERESDWFSQRIDAPTPSVDWRALVEPELLLEVDPTAVTLLGTR